MDFSFPSPLEDSKRYIHYTIPSYLFIRMPMLESINLSYVYTDADTVLANLAVQCPRLERLRWDHGGLSTSSVEGMSLQSCTNLKELYLNDFCFEVHDQTNEKLIFGDKENDDKNPITVVVCEYWSTVGHEIKKGVSRVD